MMQGLFLQPKRVSADVEVTMDGLRDTGQHEPR